MRCRPVQRRGERQGRSVARPERRVVVAGVARQLPPRAPVEVEQPEVAAQDGGRGAERCLPAVRSGARGLVPGRRAVEDLEPAVGVDPHEVRIALRPGGRDEDESSVPRRRDPRAAQAPVAHRAARHAPEHGPRRGHRPPAVVLEVDGGGEDLAPPREHDRGRRDEVTPAVRERQRARVARLAVEEGQARVAPPAAHRVEHVARVDRVRPTVRRLLRRLVDGGQRDRVSAAGRHFQQAGAPRAAEDDRGAVRSPRPAGRLAPQAADDGRRRRVVPQRHRLEEAVREESHRLAVGREEGLARALRARDRPRLEAVQPPDVEARAPVPDRGIGDPAAVTGDRHVEQVEVRGHADRHRPPRRRWRRGSRNRSHAAPAPIAAPVRAARGRAHEHRAARHGQGLASVPVAGAGGVQIRRDLPRQSSGARTRTPGPKLRSQLRSAPSLQTSIVTTTDPSGRAPAPATDCRRVPDVGGEIGGELELEPARGPWWMPSEWGKAASAQVLDRLEGLVEGRQAPDPLDGERAHLAVARHVAKRTGLPRRSGAVGIDAYSFSPPGWSASGAHLQPALVQQRVEEGPMGRAAARASRRRAGGALAWMTSGRRSRKLRRRGPRAASSLANAPRSPGRTAEGRSIRRACG